MPYPSNAEMKTFVRDYTYQASEVDSKQTCRVIALEQVKRLCLEELGTYLESHTEVVNYQLKKDEITTLTAGVVQTKILREKWDGEKYWLEAKIDADPDDVARQISALRNDVEKRKKLTDSRKNTDDALKETTRLRKELEKDPENRDKARQYNEKVQGLKMLSSFGETLKQIQSGKPEKAMDAMFGGMMEMIKNSDTGTSTDLNEPGKGNSNE
jgi:hypothetical protein